jgi:lipopolysaccharide biosynthesis protein
MTKRLFIFAGYDPRGTRVTNAELYYIRALSKLGDVVYTMDNNAPDNEIAKVRKIPNVLHAAASAHKEYDFGSYKRGYIWAADAGILKNYDWVYLVNNSVFGPFRPLKPVLLKMESSGAEFTGIAVHEKIYAQSWFMGFARKAFLNDYFDKFMRSIKKEKNKDDVIAKYEFGINRLMAARGHEIYVFLKNNAGENFYDDPLKMLNSGNPFIKKMPFSQSNFYNPAIMRSSALALKSLPDDARDMVIESLVHTDKRAFLRTWRHRDRWFRILFQIVKPFFYIKYTGDGYRIISLGLPIYKVRKINGKTIGKLFSVIPIYRK